MKKKLLGAHTQAYQQCQPFLTAEFEGTVRACSGRRFRYFYPFWCEHSVPGGGTKPRPAPPPPWARELLVGVALLGAEERLLLRAAQVHGRPVRGAVGPA